MECLSNGEKVKKTKAVVKQIFERLHTWLFSCLGCILVLLLLLPLLAIRSSSAFLEASGVDLYDIDPNATMIEGPENLGDVTLEAIKLNVIAIFTFLGWPVVFFIGLATLGLLVFMVLVFLEEKTDFGKELDDDLFVPFGLLLYVLLILLHVSGYFVLPFVAVSYFIGIPELLPKLIISFWIRVAIGFLFEVLCKRKKKDEGENENENENEEEKEEEEDQNENQEEEEEEDSSSLLCKLTFWWNFVVVQSASSVLASYTVYRYMINQGFISLAPTIDPIVASRVCLLFGFFRCSWFTVLLPYFFPAVFMYNFEQF